jgi:hypothetical protein
LFIAAADERYSLIVRMTLEVGPPSLTAQPVLAFKRPPAHRILRCWCLAHGSYLLVPNVDFAISSFGVCNGDDSRQENRITVIIRRHRLGVTALKHIFDVGSRRHGRSGGGSEPKGEKEPNPSL